MTPYQVQSLLLRVLNKPSVDRRLHYLAAKVRADSQESDKPERLEVLAACWALVSQGLVFFDTQEPAVANWHVHLTAAGKAAAAEQQVNPDDPEGYIKRLYAAVPGIGEVPRLYIDEAIKTYATRAYLACTVMLGVAAESIFMETAQAFLPWSSLPATKLAAMLDDPRASYVEKFAEFRKKLEEQKKRLSPVVRDALDVQLSAALDLLRKSRNDAGHPTGMAFDREACFSALRVFEPLVKKMYALKTEFETQPSAVGERADASAK